MQKWVEQSARTNIHTILWPQEYTIIPVNVHMRSIINPICHRFFVCRKQIPTYIYVRYTKRSHAQARARACFAVCECATFKRLSVTLRVCNTCGLMFFFGTHLKSRAPDEAHLSAGAPEMVGEVAGVRAAALISCYHFQYLCRMAASAELCMCWLSYSPRRSRR